jgi:hypothetical protein
VDVVKVQKLRVFVLLLVLGTVASMSLGPAVAAPGSGFRLSFVSGRGPADALKDQTITSAAFQPGGPAVQVELVTNSGNRVMNLPVTVTLDLLLDGGAAAGLTVTTVTTDQGLATFTDPTVSVPNIAEISDYTLVARSPSNPEVGTGTSEAFDVWGAGTICEGGACTHFTPTDPDDPIIPDSYRKGDSTDGEVITTSTFDAATSNIDCDGYDELTNFSIWHESSQGGVLFVVTHTSRDEMKNFASNGQAGVQLCLAMSHNWNALQLRGQPSQPVFKDTDGDGILDSFVGLAPKCPKKNPAAAAPCIVAQYGDGNGGNYTEAWLPGTDPGKRS